MEAEMFANGMKSMSRVFLPLDLQFRKYLEFKKKQYRALVFNIED